MKEVTAPAQQVHGHGPQNGLFMDQVRLRPATAGDIPAILALIRELAEFERDPDAVVATPDLLYEGLFGPGAVAHVVIAEDDHETYGFALYFFNFSTWTGRRGLYLEDFYVRPSARGLGIGRMLFARLATIAEESGCGRMELSVLDWNANAIRFYEKCDGVSLDAWKHYRFGVQTIAKIASTDTERDHT